MNCYLMGMMGCGKSTMARLVADKMGLCFVDLDNVIEQNLNMKIVEVFQKYGEDLFRKKESEMLLDVSLGGSQIVALGGGVPMFKNNVDVLKNTGKCIFIDRAKQDIMSDIEIKSRPLLKDGAFEQLFEKRYPVYVSVADYVVLNKNKTDTVNELVHIVSQLLEC